MNYKLIILISILIGLAFWFIQFKTRQTHSSTTELSSSKNSVPVESSNQPYKERLEQNKAYYPFETWEDNFLEYDMTQYTTKNCQAAKRVFDNLLSGLSTLGERGTEREKIALFKKAIYALNQLSNEVEALIETGEREDLCLLIDKITVVAGLNPADYAQGEGLADLWREW